MSLFTDIREHCATVPASQVTWKRLAVMPLAGDHLTRHGAQIVKWNDDLTGRLTELLTHDGMLIVDSLRADFDTMKRIGVDSFGPTARSRIGSLFIHGRYADCTRTTKHFEYRLNDLESSVHVLSSDFFSNDLFRLWPYRIGDAWNAALRLLAGFNVSPKAHGTDIEQLLGQCVTCHFDEIVLVTNRNYDRPHEDPELMTHSFLADNITR